ncbi:MAG: glucose-1-phosphate thymidylyltransferase [Synergistaceae bacterium]|jgi:glucose-1-phosphate thymidylyltransferase|nr:glucose-1-phosphate thymidylyltransferase [Synergistaceae bacterium]
MVRKGIILTVESGACLYPLTLGVGKQFLPVYDKPMIYYPLTTLMLAGIRDILLISAPQDIDVCRRLLGDGSRWGLRLEYCVQPTPGGLPGALILGGDFLAGDACTLISGDSIFYGANLSEMLQIVSQREWGATIFTRWVSRPERYDVVEFDTDGRVRGLEEKSIRATSHFAIMELYFFDKTVTEKVKFLSPSPRGDLEIVDLLRLYLERDLLSAESFGRGLARLNTDTPEALLEAGAYIEGIQKQQGLMAGCPEEIAWQQGWIGVEEMNECISRLAGAEYARYLKNLMQTVI